MALLEEITEKVHDAYFVDLFVRVSNQVGGGRGAFLAARVLGVMSGGCCGGKEGNAAGGNCSLRA
jgi:hypothetical protein